MFELIFIAILLTLAMMFNAIFTRISAERVLGLKLDMVRSTLLVAVRNLSALLCGFVFGFIIKQGMLGEFVLLSPMTAGLVVVSALALIIYWGTLRTLGFNQITLFGVLKLVTLESILMVVALGGILVVLIALTNL